PQGGPGGCPGRLARRRRGRAGVRPRRAGTRAGRGVLAEGRGVARGDELGGQRSRPPPRPLVHPLPAGATPCPQGRPPSLRPPAVLRTTRHRWVVRVHPGARSGSPGVVPMTLGRVTPIPPRVRVRPTSCRRVRPAAVLCL